MDQKKEYNGKAPEKEGASAEKTSNIKKFLRERKKIDDILKRDFTRNVTVMFTDIIESTTFFETYGDIEGRIMVQEHNEMLFPIIEKFQGSVLKTIGDAIMTMFEDPVMAVRSAIEIQQTLFDYNREKQSKKQIHVRIGINTGEGLVEQKDIYGDVVNVASRVESLAEPGQILISESVYNKAKNEEDIILHNLDEIKIKGRQEPVGVYMVGWEGDEVIRGLTRSAKLAEPVALKEEKDSVEEEKTLVMEISREGDNLKISTTKKTSEEKETLLHYDEKVFNSGRIDTKCREIVRQLNNANIRGKLAGEVFTQLKISGVALFEELLSHDVQKQISTSRCENLVINIDDGLVHIPWELLHDGHDFLCKKFNVGRVVRTRQHVIRPQLKKLLSPLRALIICDPAGDLKKAYEEGDRIRNQFDKNSFLVHSDLYNRKLGTEILKEHIKNYDIVHYAGHADYDQENPSESGWILDNSKFTCSEILQMSRNIPMPSLVFSNACKSGQTSEWKLDERFGDRIFGLANAFLLSGVQHYVGTFWEVLDEASCEFSTSFYQNLIRGESIGHAVKMAREHLITKYGEENIIWACYMLYGNPCFKYFKREEKETEEGTATYRDVHPHAAEDYEAIQAAPKRSVPLERKTFNLVIFSSIALLIAMTALFLSLKDRFTFSTGDYKKAAPKAIVSEKPDKKATIQLLKVLSEKYKDQKKLTQDKKPSDSWTSPLLTFSVTGFTCIGDIKEKDETEQFLVSNLYKELHNTGRISLVEREKLNDILDELQISTSDIAEHDMAMIMLGKLLGARLIGSGKLVKLKDETTVNLRVFETGTSRIVISLAEPWHKKEKRKAIVNLAQSITKKIESLYPLRARIIKVKEDEILLNIGTEAGARPDTRFNVFSTIEPLKAGGKTLGYDDKKIGVLRVTKIQKNLSHASIHEQTGPFKEGMRVMEAR